MATTRQELRQELRDDLRIDPNGAVWSDDVLNRFIHEGELEVARRNLVIPELQTTSTSAGTIGSKSFTLPSDFLRIIDIEYDAETVTTYTASTISFTANSTVSDSASGFGSFSVGDKLEIIGSTSNDTNTLTIATVAAGTITVEETSITTESAGASITLIGRSQPDHNVMLKRVEDIRSIEAMGEPDAAGYPYLYAQFGTTVVFDARLKEADNIKVTYIKQPQEMTADSGATGTSDIPDEMIPLVRLFAAYRAWNTLPDDDGKSTRALQNFEREFRRMVTMRGLDDYQLRVYQSANWRVKYAD